MRHHTTNLANLIPPDQHTHNINKGLDMQPQIHTACTQETTRGADKSLARPTSRCRRTESIVSLEANLLLRSNTVFFDR